MTLLPPPRRDDLRIRRDARPDSARGPFLWLIFGLFVLVAALAACWFLRPRPLLVRTAIARELASGPGANRTVLNASPAETKAEPQGAFNRVGPARSGTSPSASPPFSPPSSSPFSS